VITVPEICRLLENRGFYGGCIFPVFPLSPILSEVPRVSEFVSAEGLMFKGVLSVGEFECVVGVIVILGKNDDVIGSTFAQHQMVFRL
jgi:hypothetical protein